MKEVEVKILDINPQVIGQKIESLGGRRVGEYSFHTIQFKNLNKAQSLRIRSDGKKNILCHKQRIPHKTMKVAQETEVEVDNVEKTTELLLALGFKIKDIFKKKRTSYLLDNVHIDIDIHQDNYVFIPPILELEGKNENVIYAVAKKLGYRAKDCSTEGLGSLIKRYKK
jgi:adenylate cyclase, class 2